jgi:hypothetical protein
MERSSSRSDPLILLSYGVQILHYQFNSIRFKLCPEDDEDKVDNDVEEGLAEDHE